MKRIFLLIKNTIRFNLKPFKEFIIIDCIPHCNIKIWLLKRYLMPNVSVDIRVLRHVRCFLGSNIKIEELVFINHGVYIDDKAFVFIGKGTWLGCNVNFITATHNIETMEEQARPVHVGRYCWIGAGATILPGVTVGDYSVIGAGSIVTKNVEPCSVMVGNPAKKIRDRRVSLPYKTWKGFIDEF